MSQLLCTYTLDDDDKKLRVYCVMRCRYESMTDREIAKVNNISVSDDATKCFVLSYFTKGEITTKFNPLSWKVESVRNDKQDFFSFDTFSNAFNHLVSDFTVEKDGIYSGEDKVDYSQSEPSRGW